MLGGGTFGDGLAKLASKKQTLESVWYLCVCAIMRAEVNASKKQTLESVWYRLPTVVCPGAGRPSKKQTLESVWYSLF